MSKLYTRASLGVQEPVVIAPSGWASNEVICSVCPVTASF